MLCLSVAVTVVVQPGPSSAQEDYPSLADLSEESSIVSVQVEPSQQAASTNSTDGFVYALRDVDGGGNLIYGFKADALTGALTLLPGFPITTGGLSTESTVSELMAYDPVQNHLYVLNNGSNTISAYDVDRTDGSLAELS